MYEAVQSIAQMPIPFNMIVFVALFGSVVALVGTIAFQINAFACHCQDVAFKRELVDRGMSAEEIERIVRVKSLKDVDPEKVS
jgi:hypothetical protein